LGVDRTNVGWCLGEDTTLFADSSLLVFQEDSGDSLTIVVLDFRKTIMVKDWCPLFLEIRC